ncbi:MAG: ABC transporter permease, partial [Pseudolysinimonas sp.]
TLKATITFIGVPPAITPVFMAVVVMIVVLVQSKRLRSAVSRLVRSIRPTPPARPDLEVAP